MLTLRSFHLFFVGVSIVLASGFGVWALMHAWLLLGVVSLAIGVFLVLYLGLVAARYESQTT